MADPTPTTPAAGTGGTVSIPTHLACKLLASLRWDLTPGQQHAAEVLKRITNEALMDEACALPTPQIAPGAAPDLPAGGAGLPTVEEMAEALYPLGRWVELFAGAHYVPDEVQSRGVVWEGLVS